MNRISLKILNSKFFERFLMFSISRKLNGELREPIRFMLRHLGSTQVSEAQLFQDLWVLEKLAYKRNGFFVEVGAFDPRILSNSFILEHDFGWQGVLIEPNPHMARKLRGGRKATVLEAAISNSPGKAQLSISKDQAFSSMENQLNINIHKMFQESGEKVVVETITLTEALSLAKCPKSFDYLSIDIEGGELDAIKSLDFKRFRPKLISVEHNFRSDRELICQVLENQGYQKDKNISDFSWDDFYYDVL